MKTLKPKDVNEYIRAAPKEVQGKLKQLRAAIKHTAPKALEKISYGMPYYAYYGRLAYFAYAQKHIGLYVPPPALNEHKEELKKYSTTKATIRFPLDQEIPLALIKKVIRSRMKYNEMKYQKTHRSFK